MSHDWNGFYAAYMTGLDGQGFGMFVFAGDCIVGCDPMGVKFDGTFSTNEAGIASANIEVVVPPNGTVIQGVTSGASELKYQTQVTITPNDMKGGFFAVDTPLGPVNVRLEKLRAYDGGA